MKTAELNFIYLISSNLLVSGLPVAQHYSPNLMLGYAIELGFHAAQREAQKMAANDLNVLCDVRQK